jgi:hypothetical protein
MQPAPLRRVPPKGRISPFEPQETEMTEQKHDRIFLQAVDDEDFFYPRRGYEDDVEYIRADIVAEQLAEREGFYEKLWKDFISLQRGDFQLIALEAEECRRVKEQLAEREKQIVMLRNALQVAWDFEPECGPPCCDERISEALAATQDLSGLVLCDARPIIFSDSQTEPLYKAKDMK